MASTIETLSPALHIVEPQCPIESLPQVRVLHGHHLPKKFPPPAVGSPFLQTIANPLPDVIAAIDQRHSRRLVKRFQRPDDRQQVKSFAAEVRLGILGFKPLRSILGPQHELPLTATLGTVNAGVQQKVGCREVHRGLSYIG